jgi:hypothetical protein
MPAIKPGAFTRVVESVGITAPCAPSCRAL